jgi:hypothetical protein
VLEAAVSEPTPRQRKVIAVAVEHANASQEAQAAAAAMSLRTYQRELAAPGVEEAIRAAARQRLRGSMLGLARGASEAASALVEIAAGRAGADAARVSAAKSVLGIALKSLEVDELERRLRELEAWRNDERRKG